MKEKKNRLIYLELQEKKKKKEQRKRKEWKVVKVKGYKNKGTYTSSVGTENNNKRRQGDIKPWDYP